MVKGKVAILGGRGMLGTDLAAECGRRGMEFSVYDMPEFDITDGDMLRQVAQNCRLIVNCAAYTEQPYAYNMRTGWRIEKNRVGAARN